MNLRASWEAQDDSGLRWKASVGEHTTLHADVRSSTWSVETGDGAITKSTCSVFKDRDPDFGSRRLSSLVELMQAAEEHLLSSEHRHCCARHLVDNNDASATNLWDALRQWDFPEDLLNDPERYFS